MKKILLLTSLFLTSCVPEMRYMKEHDAWWAYNVGYSEFELGPNKYKVSYTGGSGNEPTTVMKFAYQRAHDLCKEKGYDDFVSSNATSSSLTSGGGRTGNVSFDVHTQTVYSMDVECKKIIPL